ncbi:MAG: PilZ domain-containing protein [Acidiferrobacterales bacterium]
MTNSIPTSEQNVLGAGIAYEGMLPLSWRDANPLDGLQRRAEQAANEELLRILSVLEERPQELADDHPAVAQELRRLDSKLDLVLDLVGRVLAHHEPPPPPLTVRLRARDLEWHDVRAPAAGGRVDVALYLCLRVPRPLTLSGRVRSVQPSPEGFRAVMDIDDPGEVVAELLEKIIFVHHRRTVAQTRRGAGRDEAR